MIRGLAPRVTRGRRLGTNGVSAPHAPALHVDGRVGLLDRLLLVNGDQVARWPDLRGSAGPSLGAGVAPLFRPAITPSGDPGLDFATNRWFQDTSWSIGSIQAATTFVVARSPASAALRQVFNSYFSTTRHWIVGFTGGSAFAAFTGGGTTRTFGTWSINTWYAFAVRADGDDKTGWVDGVNEAGWTDTNTGAGGPLYVGRFSNGNDQFAGDVACLLHYNSALSDTQMGDVFGWITDSFGV